MAGSPATPLDTFDPPVVPELSELPASFAAFETAADAVASFAAVLIITHGAMESPAGHECEWCCHWSLPLHLPYRNRTDLPFNVAMTYREWMVWDYHCRHHQHLHELPASASVS